jgi:hypothetical protein
MKPEIIQFYNKTKGCVDTLDQLCHTYSVSRKTRHWPMRVFYAMLDESGVDALILFINANPLWKNKKTRHGFLKNLGLELVRSHINERLTIPNLPRNLKIMIMKSCKIENSPSKDIPAGSKKRCSYCPRKNYTKNSTMCVMQEANVHGPSLLVVQCLR